jgi:uncharacterized small protein (DUF1192 family)
VLSWLALAHSTGHHGMAVRRRKMEEEDRPKPKFAHVLGENLDMVSIEELHQRVILLEAEITRIKAEIERKTASKSAADSFFKS